MWLEHETERTGGSNDGQDWILFSVELEAIGWCSGLGFKYWGWICMTAFTFSLLPTSLDL